MTDVLIGFMIGVTWLAITASIIVLTRAIKHVLASPKDKISDDNLREMILCALSWVLIAIIWQMIL